MTPPPGPKPWPVSKRRKLVAMRLPLATLTKLKAMAKRAGKPMARVVEDLIERAE